MEISLRTTRPGDRAVLESLFNSLNDSEYIRQNSRIKLPERKQDDMGVDIEALNLILSAGFKLGELAWAIVKWYLESKEPLPPIDVKSPGGTTTLFPEDMTDPGDGNFTVRRALVGASDPAKSRCLLIGISNYTRKNLRGLPGVKQNVQELSAALLDQEIWGIPEENLTVMDYPRSDQSIKDAISTAVGKDPHTLLIYFAGHGLYDEREGLLLALPEATGTNREATIRWEDIAELLKAYRGRSIVWLDCCYAGLAVPGKHAQRNISDPPEMLNVIDAHGSYLLAATQGNEEAKAMDDGGCTAFTGELVNVLRNGVKPGPPTEEFVSLNSVHQQVSSALREKKLPLPDWHDPGNVGQLPHFRNNYKRKEEDSEGGGEPTRRRRSLIPANFDKRRIRQIAASGVAAIALLAGLIAYQSIPGPVVSGVDFSKYCSTLTPVGVQRFGVAGTDCVQKVSLDAACAYSYPGQPDIKAEFFSSDPNSAVCEGSGVTYGGISDMSGYCFDHTTVVGVTATAKNRYLMDIWACQVEINEDLACAQQNRRTDLIAREGDDQVWTCRKSHLF